MAQIVLEKPTTRSLEVFDWDGIVGSIAGAFCFDYDETQRFAAKDLAQLIGATPFIAGCKDPLRTALSHLGTYVLSVRLHDAALARPTDDEYLFRRIELLGNFIGGNEELIQRSMNLIALYMLLDYVRDMVEDQHSGKYNPVSSGSFDPLAERERLLDEITRVPCPEMDRILSPGLSSDWDHFWLW